MDHVPANGDRRWQHRDMVGRRATALVAGAAGKQQLERVALHPHGGGIAIGGHHPVVGIERSRTAYLSCLLAFEGGVGRQPSLFLSDVTPLRSYVRAKTIAR